MKKIFLFLSFFVAITSQAQPIMNNLYNFQFGHVYSYKKVPVGWNIDTALIQTIGNNITWNFDTISLLPSVFSDSILDPTGTAGAPFFNGANFVWKEYSGLLQYYRKNADTVFYMGNYSSWPSTFTPNPITSITNTSLSSSYLYANFQTVVSSNGTWIYDARYNAFGTLKLPGVTHNNVGLYVTVGGNNTKYADYFWFKENQNDPVLRIQFVWTSSSSVVQYLYVNTTALTPSNVSNIEKTLFTLQPNPVTDNLILTSPFTITNCEIRNLFGQVVSTYQCNNTTTQIDVSSLSKGIFFVTVTDEGNRRFTQKFIK